MTAVGVGGVRQMDRGHILKLMEKNRISFALDDPFFELQLPNRLHLLIQTHFVGAVVGVNNHLSCPKRKRFWSTTDFLAAANLWLEPDFHRAYLGVPQNLLYGPDIVSIFQQMGGERMP